MTEEDDKSLSAAELKSKLYQTFKQKGWEDALKVQLRKRLVAELQHGALKQSLTSSRADQSERQPSLTMRAVNSLIADHLRRCDYEYSLSVFLPESDTSREKMFTTQDLLELLHVHPSSALYKKLAKEIPYYESKGFLWQLLIELVRIYGKTSASKGVQVDELPAFRTSIEKKLSAVDKHYNILDSERKKRGEHLFQERLLVMQKEMDNKAKAEMNAELSRFKETELKRVELDLKEKSRREISEARREMEAAFQTRVKAVEARERSASERFREHQQALERETYSQRQNLLQQLKELQQRETDLRREAEVNARAAKLEEDKRKAIEENLKFREASVSNIEQNYERKFQEEVKSFQLDQEVKWKERLNDLERKERQVREEKKYLTDEKASIQKITEELQDRKKQMNELEEHLQEARTKLISENHRNEMLAEKLRGVVDYPMLKEDNAVLRRELENTKMRLAEAASEEKAEKRRNEELIKQLTEKMSQPSPELISIRGELERARDQLHQERAIMKQKEEHWKIKIQEETQRNLELKHQLEDQTKQMQEMVKELSSLRTILRETQRALHNEVYRRTDGQGGSSSLSQLYPGHTSLSGERHVPVDGSDSLLYPVEGNHGNYQPSSEHRPVRDLDLSDESSLSSFDEGVSTNFVEETRARMRQLEMEAETLNRNYQEFQQRLADPVSDMASSPYRNSSSRTKPVRVSPVRNSAVSSGSFSKVPDGKSVTQMERDISNLQLVDEDSKVTSQVKGHSGHSQSKKKDEDQMGKPSSRRNLFGQSSEIRRPNIPVSMGTVDNQYSHLTDESHERVVSRLPRDEEIPNSRQRERARRDGEAGNRQEMTQMMRYDEDPGKMNVNETPRESQTDQSEQIPRQNEGQDHSRDSERARVNDGKQEDGLIPTVARKQDEDEERMKKEEEEQREWEERRRKKEEERRRKEEEARERERQMLLELQRQEESDQTKETDKGAIDKPDKEEPPKKEDDGLKIDPVMQKYMEMAQKRRLEESKKQEEEQVEREESELSMGRISQGSISGDEKEDSPVTKDESKSEDPFDDW